MRAPFPQRRPLLLLLFVSISLAALLAAVWDDESDRHAWHANNLIELKELDARLDRDLLQIASFMLLQYDPMVETVRQLHQIEQWMQSPESRFYAGTSGINEASDQYWATLQQKLDLAERVKSQAAVVRNGLHYLPVAVEGLKDGDPAIYQKVLRLLNRLLQFNLFTSQSSKEGIQQDMDELALLTELPPAARGILDNILFHMHANLNGLSRLDELESGYISIPSGARFNALNEAHEAYRKQRLIWTQRLKLSLSLLVLVLVLGLWLTMRRWDAARHASEQSWHRLHDAVESIAEAFALFDAGGRLVLYNKRYLTFYPWLRSLLTRSTSLDEIRRINETHFRRRSMNGSDPEVRGEIHLEQIGDGRWYLASDSRTSEGGTVLVRTDITRTKQAEEELRKLSRALEQSPVSVVITDTQGIIEYVNPKFEAISGYKADEALGQNPRILKSDEKSAAEYGDLWSTIKSGKEWRGNFHNQRPDGTMYWESASISPLRNEQGDITHYIAVKEDITQRKKDEKQIRYQATFDALTRLPNRTLLLDRLTQAIASARREDWKLGLMFIDLDHFKGVNDTFGHVTGDELLQRVAQRLQGAVRESDTIARFGGDEFVVLLQDIKEAGDAGLVADTVISTLAAPFKLNDREIYIGASVGITLYPDDADNADTLLQYADMAMYQAKESGRNRYQFFTQSMQEQVRQRLDLEQDLRLALGRGELELHYQPIVETGTLKPVSSEALLRWHHPRWGLLGPDRFISIAENTGLIGPIGEWVLQTACHQLAKWRASGLADLHMSINISRRQRDSGLSGEYLGKLLQQTGLPGGALSLEITESLLMEDTQDSIAWLTELKTQGIRIAVDDFGTGYSSLSYLKRFPVDIIKIDRSFIKDLPDDKDDILLVETIVAMARSLGHRLVAEGVESKQQLDILSRLGCDYQQGYLFSRPMPAGQCSRWFQEHQSRRSYA